MLADRLPSPSDTLVRAWPRRDVQRGAQPADLVLPIAAMPQLLHEALDLARRNAVDTCLLDPATSACSLRLRAILSTLTVVAPIIAATWRE